MSDVKDASAGGDGFIPKENMDQFIKVSQALKTIRDKRLYRQEYPTFDAYCRGRWGIDGAQAELYIAFAEVELETRRTKTNLQ
jgi:hypothetical protein